MSAQERRLCPECEEPLPLVGSDACVNGCHALAETAPACTCGAKYVAQAHHEKHCAYAVWAFGRALAEKATQGAPQPNEKPIADFVSTFPRLLRGLAAQLESGMVRLERCEHSVSLDGPTSLAFTVEPIRYVPTAAPAGKR